MTKEIAENLMIIHQFLKLGGGGLSLGRIVEQVNHWGKQAHWFYENRNDYCDKLMLDKISPFLTSHSSAPFPYLRKPGSWHRWFAFKRKLNELREGMPPGATLFSGDLYTLPTALMSRKKGDRVISLLQGEYRFDDDSCVRKWKKYWADRADLLVANEAVAAHANQTGLLSQHVHTLNPWVDVERFKPGQWIASEARRELKLPKGKQIALCFGRLGEGKGQYWLAEAFLADRSLRRDWLLCFVGPVPAAYSEYWKALIARSDNTIRWVGPQTNIPTWLAVADLVLFPGILQESFGLAMIEAVLMERATLLFPVGALPQLLGPHHAGFVRPVGDHDVFMESWRNWSSTSDDLSTLRRELATRFSRQSWEKALRRVLQV